jgi:hypothetical protein
VLFAAAGLNQCTPYDVSLEPHAPYCRQFLLQKNDFFECQTNIERDNVRVRRRLVQCELSAPRCKCIALLWHELKFVKYLDSNLKKVFVSPCSSTSSPSAASPDAACGFARSQSIALQDDISARTHPSKIHICAALAAREQKPLRIPVQRIVADSQRAFTRGWAEAHALEILECLGGVHQHD